MMGSSNHNLDLHHQEDLHATSSSFIPWNPDLMILSATNSGNSFPINGALSSSRDFMRVPMVQELGFQWGTQADAGSGDQGYMTMNMNIKEELSEPFAKLAGINLQDYNLIHGLQPSVGGELGFGPLNPGSRERGSYSTVLPSASVSDSGLQSFYPSSTGLMDLQALASARFGRTMALPLNTVALWRENLASSSVGQLQQVPAQAPVSTSHHNSGSGATEAKRSNGLDSRTSQPPPPPPAKKPRFEARSSFTTFKVRKEKLGDRIAALQQLVAPFGKTDTASVLMEAIGYIKFLQDQVETLSVPYMRSSKKASTSRGGSSEDQDEPKADLRSRGLCLVPLSCTSYVTNENGGVWSPPNYHGGT